MIKVVTIIGARPQIIKAAALSRSINNAFSNQINEIIVHTGQHYDHNMSQVFFNELGIPKPDYNLEIGSSTHGIQTARMIEGIEELILKEIPDYTVLYGDTNSTLAGAIAASKVHIPIIHIEAGLRSFNKKMPEEINRLLSDHVSTYLFSPTLTGIRNLKNEGLNTDNMPPYTFDNPGVFHSGDIMFDNTLYFDEIAKSKSKILKKYNLAYNEFILVTIHRDTNTDDEKKLNSIFNSLLEISDYIKQTFFLPLHPRTRKMISTKLSNSLVSAIQKSKYIKMIDPVSFLDMIQLERSANMIITDSGGVQKEAYFFKKPCIILREQTEWVEIVENGCAKIVGADSSKIEEAYAYFAENQGELRFEPIFGDGNAANFICKTILENK